MDPGLVKYCGICTKPVALTHRRVLFTVHGTSLKCADITPNAYTEYKITKEPWACGPNFCASFKFTNISINEENLSDTTLNTLMVSQLNLS